MKSNEKKRITHMTETVAGFIQNHSTDSPEDIKIFLKNLNKDSNTRVVIYDVKSRVIYDSQNQSLGSVSKTVKKALKGENGSREYKEKNITVIDSSVPYFTDGRVAGAVNIVYRSNEISEFVRECVSNTLILSLLILLLVGVIIFVFAHLITQRIVDFTRKITSMSDGNLNEKLDITGNDEISKLGEAFNELSEKVSVLEKQRTEFVSNASHELKTPLSSIKLMADSIIQTPDIEMDYVREFLADMNEEVERLNRIVNKLLYITKMDTLTESMSGSLELINLKDVVNGIHKNLIPIAEIENKELICNADEDILIMANKDILWQAVYNIADNALKYTMEYGRVEIGLVKEGKKAVITVKDNGVGIAPDDIDRIFDRFYRVDKARSRATGGTGLGLSIAQSAIEFHNGTIEVSSELNVGSEFKITLPLVEWF